MFFLLCLFSASLYWKHLVWSTLLSLEILAHFYECFLNSSHLGLIDTVIDPLPHILCHTVICCLAAAPLRETGTFYRIEISFQRTEYLPTETSSSSFARTSPLCSADALDDTCLFLILTSAAPDTAPKFPVFPQYL